MEQNTVVIHIKDATGEPNEVYIGRAGHGKDGYFGNPIAVHKICPMCSKIHKAPGETMACYGDYLDNRLKHDAEFKKRIMSLRGKRLVCFCKSNPNKKCHGDYIVNRINKLYTPAFEW